ncbi:MAG: PIN domain-containing protein [Nitrospinae bacterium]|nr:PIN domain-containing protein [Nitrospinota bacterium]
MIFIDSNILIYSYSSTEIGKKDKVLLILENEEIAISTQVINEFIWIMSRKFNVDMESLKVINNNLFEIFNVGMVSKATIDKAIDIAKSYKYAYWDSLMLSSALESRCIAIYSEDMQHGQNIEGVRIINPFL